MALNDKIKGSYYQNYQATLASRTSIYNIINELKTYYTDLVYLVNNTYSKITEYRSEMIEKLNAILLKINVIEYNINNFNYEIDSSIEEKLKKLMENYDSDFVNIVNSYNNNLYNHAKLEDSYSSNDSLYEQPVSEYESSIEKLNTSLGLRWYGGKFNDKNLLGKLNNILNIVKYNSYEGLNQEDHVNSNLILDIFISSTKGITWLTLGKNAKFGYNIRTKYHSLRNKDLSIKIKSTDYYNQKSYEINKFDMNFLLNFGYTEDDIENKNIYIKIRTNIPANTYSGLDEYYISSTNNLVDFNSKRVIANLGKRHISHNNRDYAYNIGKISSLSSFRANNKKNDRETDYISDFVDKNLDKTNSFSDNNFNIYSDISISKGTNSSKNSLIQTIKRSSDNKEITGLTDNVGAITVNASESSAIDYDKAYIGDETSFDNKSDENENILYSDDKERINLTDYRNVGNNIGLITENENTFVINNELEDNNSVTVIGKTQSLKENTNPALINEVSNNRMLDINTESDFGETPELIHINSVVIGKIAKKQEISNGDLLVLNTDNNLFVISNMNKDIVQITKDTRKFYDFLQINDETLFLFTDLGIFYISSEDIKTKTYTNVQASNIVNGSFTTAYLNDEGTSFYCINNSSEATVSQNTSTNKYELTNFIYIYDISDTNIRDYKDYCSEHLINNDEIAADTNTDLLKLISSKTSGYKILRWKNANVWLLLHKDTGKIYISKNEKFGNFVLSDLVSKTIPNIELFSIDKSTGNVYLADHYVAAHTKTTYGKYHYIIKTLTKVDTTNTTTPDSNTIYYKLTQANVTAWEENKEYYTKDTDSGTLSKVDTATVTTPTEGTVYYTLEDNNDVEFDSNSEYYYYVTEDKAVDSMDDIPDEYKENNTVTREETTTEVAEVTPNIYELSSDNGEYKLTPVMKANVYTENNLSKFIRNVQLDCGSNMTGSGITATDIVNEMSENLVYRGYEPVRVDGILYVPNKDITEIVDINGFYYILVPNGNVIYKINHDKVLVGNIKLDSLNITDSDTIELFSYNDTLFIVKSNTNSVIYTDKESLKVHSELFNDSEGIYIISTNKIINGYVTALGGGGLTVTPSQRKFKEFIDYFVYDDWNNNIDCSSTVKNQNLFFDLKVQTGSVESKNNTVGGTYPGWNYTNADGTVNITKCQQDSQKAINTLKKYYKEDPVTYRITPRDDVEYNYEEIKNLFEHNAVLANKLQDYFDLNLNNTNGGYGNYYLKQKKLKVYRSRSNGGISGKVFDTLPFIINTVAFGDVEPLYYKDTPDIGFFTFTNGYNPSQADGGGELVNISHYLRWKTLMCQFFRDVNNGAGPSSSEYYTAIQGIPGTWTTKGTKDYELLRKYMNVNDSNVKEHPTIKNNVDLDVIDIQLFVHGLTYCQISNFCNNFFDWCDLLIAANKVSNGYCAVPTALSSDWGSGYYTLNPQVWIKKVDIENWVEYYGSTLMSYEPHYTGKPLVEWQDDYKI